GILFQKYLEVDTVRKQFRKIHGLLYVFKMKEKWQKLPRLDFILIFKTLYVKCETCTPEEFEKNGVYQLSVVYNKKRKFVLDVSGEKNKIFTEARLLAKEWNLKIMDSASVRGKSFWVEPQTV
ncbi:MAG: hypothetical protein N3F09_07515, partial [Bacteroidia bacterium]|nr:hypothetical protein [Bacteroidia bacterium]